MPKTNQKSNFTRTTINHGSQEKEQNTWTNYIATRQAQSSESELGCLTLKTTSKENIKTTNATTARTMKSASTARKSSNAELATKSQKHKIMY